MKKDDLLDHPMLQDAFAEDDVLEATVELGGEPIPLDVHDVSDQNAVSVAAVLDRLPQMYGVAAALVAAGDHEQVRGYLEHHRAELPEVNAPLTLAKVWFMAGQVMPTFDYSIGEEHTDYVLSVCFTSDGTLNDVSIES